MVRDLASQIVIISGGRWSTVRFFKSVSIAHEKMTGCFITARYKVAFLSCQGLEQLCAKTAEEFSGEKIVLIACQTSNNPTSWLPLEEAHSLTERYSQKTLIGGGTSKLTVSSEACMRSNSTHNHTPYRVSLTSMVAFQRMA